MKTWFLGVFLLLQTVVCLGQNADDKLAYEPIGDHTQIFKDSTHSLGIQEILKLDDAFHISTQRVPNLGVTENAWWIRLTLEGGENPGNYLLELAKPTIDYVTFYYPDSEESYDSLVTGYQQPIEDRYFENENFIFPIDLEVNTSKTYYIRVQSAEQIQVPLYLSSEHAMFKKLSRLDLLFGLFTGIFFVMFFYNTFIYFSTRDRSYLMYVIYILIVYLTQASLLGYGYRLYWPNSPIVELYSVYIIGGLVGMAVILFFNEFLQIKKNLPKGYRLLQVYFVLFVLTIGLAFFNLMHESYILLQGLVGSLSVIQTIMTIMLIKKGVRQARFFMLAWGIFLLGTFVFILKDFNILPYNTLTASGMQIGSAIEVILLSFALADRINILKKEKEQSQARALQVLRENERIIKEQNVILESKVKERTEKLQKSNEELNHTLDELKSTQSQLVDAEKMASLGQLTAGIAHELNNPINFVASNVKPLERDFNDLIRIIDKMDELKLMEEDSKTLKEVMALKAELDTDYLKDEIRQLLAGVSEGAKRTAEIVRGLRIFSRLDEDSLKRANVNECLESTIIVLKSHLKGRVTVFKDLDENLPAINCYPGKLNQVFMNIISNAAQATENTTLKVKDRKVKIKTCQDEENIYISISDNGSGMDEETKHRVFDPFFTTKEVGEGTGLGLSIVLGIIKDHNGKIEVNSQLNKGTEFLITLSKSLDVYRH